MIGWVTTNVISQKVMAAVEESGIEVRPMNQFMPTEGSIFYGILRASGYAMRLQERQGLGYYYIDNGYFGAEYVNSENKKQLTGKYRVVKNGMLEVYEGPRINKPADGPKKALLLSPSPYAANHYDATPEDWNDSAKHLLRNLGYEVVLRNKGHHQPIDSYLDGVGLVLGFNSLACMRVIERGIPCYDTHGIFRNAYDLYKHDFVPEVAASIEDLQAFYEPKQYTLEEIKAGKVNWS